MMDNDILQRPNRIPWPPILYLGAIAVALALEAIWPTDTLLAQASTWRRVAGVAIAAMGFGFDLTAMRRMRRARTNILPHRGAEQLLTSGVFAVSRNPIYLGNTLLLAGIALAFSLPWLLASTLAASVLVEWLAIRREERHLAARFGQAFADYTRRVPRWIGWRPARRRHPGENE